jgi:FdhE protein
MSLVAATTKLVSADELGAANTAAPRLLLPDARTVFHQRAKRLHELAKDHQLKEWLTFCATLSEVQNELAHQSTPAQTYSLADLNIENWQSENSWSDWQQVLKAMSTKVITSEQQVLIEQLSTWDKAQWQMEAQALLLANELNYPEAAPFIAAALQLEWTIKASQAETLPQSALPTDAPLCPVCGSHPMVSVVYTGDPIHGVRYLVCSLCNSQWYATRAKCTNCHSPKPVALLGKSMEASVQGECCDACNSYVKLLSLLKDIHLDPCADDLASLGLDIALSEANYHRAARNLFLAGMT